MNNLEKLMALVIPFTSIINNIHIAINITIQNIVRNK